MNKLKTFFYVIIFLLFVQKSYSETDFDVDHLILMDHLSGDILFEKNADDEIYPASMTKIMTALVVFDY